jgi:hypothetical protein
LTDRERAVLDALLNVSFDGVEPLREQAATVEVVHERDCGCPSIDFSDEPGARLRVRSTRSSTAPWTVSSSPPWVTVSAASSGWASRTTPGRVP